MPETKTKRKSLNLLKKGSGKLLRIVFSRTGLILCLLLAQFVLLFAGLFWFGEFLPHLFGGNLIFTLFMALVLLKADHDPTVKLTWLIVIMVFPVFGAVLYWYSRRDLGHRALKQVCNEQVQATRYAIDASRRPAEQLAHEDPGAGAMTQYVRRSGCYPVYDRTAVTYFPQGEDKFARMLEELEKAERFIFLEYFIVDEGTMWGQILEVLARKAAQGVEVRLMYDGFCELHLLPKDYPLRLKELGIQCKVFSPVVPFASTHYNYRDHRKILVIDGHTAFNGGINLADEYINEIDRFGHWKDTAVMLKGEAVKSFTLMFLQIWNVDTRVKDYHKFLSYPAMPQEAKGFVMPYADSPLDNEMTGRQVYVDILNRARRYVHIMTPYLILDSQMENALRYAALRGVDVKLLLPGIPDKKLAFALAKTHYSALLDAGVKIYEYTPGFVHAKSFVCDDREAVVGTINLDYRSLYHHFECATYMHSVDAIGDIEADFQRTVASCRRITREIVRQEKWYVKLTGFLLKALAPLL